MYSTKKKYNALDSEKIAEIERQLQQMEADKSFKTESSYSANITTYPNNLIPFVDKHMAYLKQHQNLNPQQYLSNLRLMTRMR